MSELCSNTVEQLNSKLSDNIPKTFLAMPLTAKTEQCARIPGVLQIY